MSAPNKCPMCGNSIYWKNVETGNKGFSVGKAVVGEILFGPVGLVGGALGKKKQHIAVGNADLSMNIQFDNTQY